MTSRRRIFLSVLALGCTDLPAQQTGRIDLAQILAGDELVAGPHVIADFEYAVASAPMPSPAALREQMQAFGKDDRVNRGKSITLPQLPYFDFSALLTPGQWGIFRIRLEIQAAQPEKICLFSDGRLNYRIRLNGVEVAAVTNARWIEKYGACVVLELRAGLNFCDVVVGGTAGTCGLSLVLTSVTRASEQMRMNWLPESLDRYVYAPGECLQAGGVATGAEKIPPSCDDEGKSVPNADGIYRVRSRGPSGDDIVEKIAVCDPDQVKTRILRMRARLVASNAEALADFEVLAQRLLFLLPVGNRRQERRIGDRDLVEMLEELLAVEAGTGSDRMPEPGRHFAAFFSSYRGRNAPYMIYVPPGTRRGERLPLVVVVPSAAPSRIGFTESYPIDFSDLVHLYMQAADLNRMIVLWPYANNLDHVPLTETLIDENIAAVLSRFPVDAKKIALIGACGAGRDGLVFAARQPRQLMAVASHQTTFQSDLTSANPRAAAMTTPLYLVRELARTPTFLSIGELDRHVRRDATLVLADSLRQVGGEVVLRVIPGADEGYYPSGNNQWIAEAFSFFRVKATLVDTAPSR